MRIDTDPVSDDELAVLANPITFEFSGKTAPNRFLKAPMTERLCLWNDEEKGQDEVRNQHPFVRVPHLWHGSFGHCFVPTLKAALPLTLANISLRSNVLTDRLPHS